MTANGFRAVVDIDLVGSFHVMRQAHAYLRRPGASVVNIYAPQASAPMRYGNAEKVPRGARIPASGGLRRCKSSQYLRVLLRFAPCIPSRIGARASAGTYSALPYQAHAAAAKAGAAEAAVPSRRFGSTDDIANLALFLASPYASYVSGAVIPCDGGGAIDSVKPALERAGSA